MVVDLYLQSYQQWVVKSDVLLIPTQQQQSLGQKLPHLTLAEGEVTRHKHRITGGSAQLYEENGTLYLRVLSETTLLTCSLEICFRLN